MTIFFMSVFSVYFLCLLYLLVGWMRVLKEAGPVEIHRYHFISVIIPFRNEAHHIQTLLSSLRMLDYPPDKFEVLLIDDQSTDTSATLATEAMTGLANVKVIVATANGKKNAIMQGIRDANGEIIATTDADCELPTAWLFSINRSFQDPSLKMLVGAVRIGSNDSFFSRLQAVEFNSLMGSAVASLEMGIPLMCNGANLSYRKEVFQAVGGFEDNIQIASGDDEFLMRKVVDNFGAKGVAVLPDPNAVVTTYPQVSVRDFFAQRFRWAGKWKHNSSGLAKTVAIFVLIVQCSWLWASASLFFLPLNNTIFIFMIVKVVMEGYFLLAISRFMRQSLVLSAFLLLQVIYPFYVIAVGTFSNVITVSWKERPLSN